MFVKKIASYDKPNVSAKYGVYDGKNLVGAVVFKGGLWKAVNKSGTKPLVGFGTTNLNHLKNALAAL